MSILTTDGREVQARGHKTRDRLLAAGAEVFASKGFHAARVDDIVRAATTSHGTFYVYFTSKETLFDELVARVVDDLSRLLDRLPEAVAGGGDAAGPDAGTGRAGLRSWLAEFGRFYDESGPVLRVWTEVQAADRGAGGEVLLRLAGDLGDRLAVPGAGRTTVDGAVVALAVVAMVERFHLYATSGWLRADPGEIVDTLTEVVGDALGA